MTSVREQAIIAIVDQLASVGSFTVARNEVVPAVVGEGGHVVVRDGTRLDSQMTLGVHSYYVTHRVVIEAQAAGADPDGALDDLLAAVEQALSADPTLGGVALSCTLDLDDIEMIAGDGASAIKSALFGAILEYETVNALE